MCHAPRLKFLLGYSYMRTAIFNELLIVEKVFKWFGKSGLRKRYTSSTSTATFHFVTIKVI